MGAKPSQNAAEQASVEAVLDDHPNIEFYTWRDHGNEVHAEFEDEVLVSRTFVDDMADAGMMVEFADFKSNKICFSRV